MALFREEEVRRGIALLDEKKPDWRKTFKPEKLDMFDLTRCTLGQTFGWYEDGLQRLGVPYGMAEEFGFTVFSTPSTREDSIEKSFVDLTRTWVALTQPN